MAPRRASTSRVVNERGAAAVEFAIVAPLLVLLLFGIISFGVMLSMRQSVSQAAAEGARAAAVTLIDADRTAEATDAIDDALSANGVTCDGTVLKRAGENVGSCSVGPKIPCREDSTAECVTVTVTYTYRDDPIVPSFGVGALMPETLSYSATARVS